MNGVTKYRDLLETIDNLPEGVTQAQATLWVERAYQAEEITEQEKNHLLFAVSVNFNKDFLV